MEARAMYAEGLTMAQLAAVLGVSRQRVSTLLRDTSDGTAMDGLDVPQSADHQSTPAGP